MTLRHPVRSIAIALTGAVTIACHGGKPSTPVPVAGTCGQRGAVALVRGSAPKRAASRPGALVIRIASADSGLRPPEGPVRLYGDGATTAQVLPLAGHVAKSGPLSAGRYTVEANGTGYHARRLAVTVRSGATDTVRFRLAAQCVRRGR